MRETTISDSSRRVRPEGWLVALVLVGLAVFPMGCSSASTQQRQQAMLMMEARSASGAGGVGAATGGAAGVVSPDGTTSASALPVAEQYSYRLAPGDLIDVKFPYHPEENERVPVRPDGRVSLQVTGDVQASGLSVKELEDSIAHKASKYLRDPVVSVVIAQMAEHKVYVGGDVLKPGFVPFRDGLTPLQAVIERGGFTDTADLDEVLYISHVGSEYKMQRLDLDSIVDGESTEQVVMAPDDIVFVPKTGIGKANVIVDQWIRGLLPTVPRPGFDLNQVAF